MDLLDELNEPQRRAVQCIDGPLLILAGAGSGKTRVITRRVAYLIDQGVAPWQVLAITFTNKAAGEMAQRVANMHAPRGATICTFHSLCARLLREFAELSGLSSNYTIYDRDDQLRLVKDAMHRLEIPAEQLNPSAVHAAIGQAKNELKTARNYANAVSDFAGKKIAEVYVEYERLLASNNAVDFDDLLLRMAFLLRDHPAVRQTLADRYRYVMVDEYQDTNRSQYILAHGIAGEHGNLCVTGDPDQSIYAWRGANIRNILEFEADYPDATVIRLEENYRSTKAILGAASSLISYNRQRKDKALWTQRQGGANVTVMTLDDGRAEAAAVAQAVIRHRAEGRELNDIAVFYRVNSLSRVIEETLFNGGIPYRVARGVAFYNRKEIKDVLAYLKVIANSADDLSCRRVINTPKRGIGGTTVGRVEAFAAQRALSLMDACRNVDQAGLGNAPTRKVAAFAEMIDALAAQADEKPLGELIAAVAAETGIEAALKGDDDRDNQAWGNVGELISSAVQFDELAGGSAPLEDFLHQVSLVSDVDKMEGPGGAVTLMTLHAAKGLEFPVVFVVGCEEGMLPFKRQQWGSDSWGKLSDADLEEERRLAFVGMTRAKDDLTLTHVVQRFIHGQTTSQAPSRFLNEIAPEFTDRVNAVTSRSSSRRGRRFAGRFYDDADLREQIEAMDDDFDADHLAPSYDDDVDVDHDTPSIPPEYEHLRRGCRVYHTRFGYGKLTRVGAQVWPQTKVDVTFDDYGHKTLVLAMAKLEIG